MNNVVHGGDRGQALPGPPRTLEEWMNEVGRRLNALETVPRGIGVFGWNDVQLGAGFIPADTRLPGWRRTNDGRVELRGRLRKSSGAAVNKGDVVMYLPYECAPPNNQQQIPSSVSVLGPATIGSNSSGVCRYDIQRETAWRTEQQEDLQGNPVYDDEGRPVIVVVSRVEVVAMPGSGSINGWVGFDHVVFDPWLYVDTLPAVPKGQKPLVPDPGIAVVQHPGGRVEFFTPGVLSS